MGSGGSKAKKDPAQPMSASAPLHQNQDPYQQQPTGNLPHSATLPQNQQYNQTVPPVQNQPIRQQTQVQPVQTNPIPQAQTNPVSQAQTPGTQSMAQSLHSLSQPLMATTSQPIMKRNASERDQLQQEQDDSPNILFLFDFQEKIFYYYNTVSNEWKYNDLTKAMDNCPRCPLMKYRTDGEEGAAVQYGKYMSYIALSEEQVYLIGGYNSFYSCLVYDIKKNSFLTRSPINVCRNTPSLCRFNSYIYAVSGDQIDSYSIDVGVYDSQNNEWSQLPDLPYPQGCSSTCVIYGKKLAVLGGLTQKFPRTYTPLLSLYTFGQPDWEVFDLTKIFTQRVPRFINSAMVQNREGDLIILGSEATKSVFKFDLENLQLAACGRIPEEDSFNMPMRSKEALFRNNLVHCLSHKQEMKVYQGYLTLEKWELV